MKKVLTLVIDGLGINEEDNKDIDILSEAKMPIYNELLSKYPNTLLYASGCKVGLHDKQSVDENIGFQTLGSGTVIKQRSSYMHEFTDKDSLATNARLKSVIEHAKKYKSTIHIMGLMSDAGISSSIDDTVRIIDFLKTQEVNMVIDFIADGKDTETKCALKYVEMLEKTGVQIASICGRYYAMDDEEKWDRVKIYYDLVFNGIGLKIKEIPLALKNCYMRNITDEYLPPMIVNQNCSIKSGDILLWTNFLGNGGKEFLSVITGLCQINDIELKKLDDFRILSMFKVDDAIDTEILIEKEDNNISSIGSYLGKLELTQARIALERSYDFVTKSFNALNLDKIPKCNNYLVDIPKIEVDKTKELGAAAVTKQIIKCMEKDTDFILASIDLLDEVGHIGDREQSLKALEFVDECLGKIMESASLNFYTVFITSTHGNIEKVTNDDGKPSTTHTTNRVPLIVTDSKLTLDFGSLSDIAPTILYYMDISIPDSMKESKILIK